MNGRPLFTADRVFLSRLTHSPLSRDPIRQLGRDLLSGVLNANQVFRR